MAVVLGGEHHPRMMPLEWRAVSLLEVGLKQLFAGWTNTWPSTSRVWNPDFKLKSLQWRIQDLGFQRWS